MNLKTKQTKIRQNYNAIELMWFLFIEIIILIHYEINEKYIINQKYIIMCKIFFGEK